MTIPELRFKADDGSEFPDWEGKKLGDNVKFINGRAYSQDELLSVGKYQVLRVGNLFTNDTYYYSDMELEPDKYIEDGDLIYAWSATFGPRIYIGNKCIYHYHIWKLKFDENIVSKTFLNYILERDVEKIMSQRTGGTMVHITKSAMENRELFFPSLPEQKKIASFLSTIDDIITTTEAELTAWQERKKGVMQKIFNREVRFKADDGSEFSAWEERRIDSFANCYAGATPSTKVAEYWQNGSIPWMSSGEVNNREIYETEKKISELGYEKSSTKMIKPNTVVIALAGQGKTRGMVAIARISVCTNQSLCAIETNDMVNDDYLYQYLITQYDNLRRISSGDGTRGGLNLQLVGEYKVFLPVLHEQRKIADCLSSLDDVINQIKAELSAWKEFKKGLLQQMFV